MNGEDRVDIKQVDEKVGRLDIRLGNCEGGVETIITNHLPHMKEKQEFTVKLIAWLFAWVTIMIAGLGILLVVVVG